MSFKNSTDENFQKQISGSKLSLIQFSAEWCNPCQVLKPIIEKISNDLSDKIECFYHDIEVFNIIQGVCARISYLFAEQVATCVVNVILRRGRHLEV